MLGKRFFKDFSTSHQGHIDLFPQEVKDKLSESDFYLLDFESGGFGLEVGFLELSRRFKSK